jgi:hypothetical protein
LNDLLADFGVAFGDKVFEGDFSLGNSRAHVRPLLPKVLLTFSYVAE